VSKSNNAYLSGIIAENNAIDIIKKLNYHLLKKRYKTKNGEIDAILYNKNEDILLFLEVKYRKNKIFNYENILSQKQLYRITSTASDFISENKEYTESRMRFDICIIEKDFSNIIHIENITF
jgi:putative endonuclease